MGFQNLVLKNPDFWIFSQGRRLQRRLSRDVSRDVLRDVSRDVSRVKIHAYRNFKNTICSTHFSFHAAEDVSSSQFLNSFLPPSFHNLKSFIPFLQSLPPSSSILNFLHSLHIFLLPFTLECRRRIKPERAQARRARLPNAPGRHLERSDFTSLISLPDVVYEDLVRLFYYNLVVETDQPDSELRIRSYVAGRRIDLDIHIISDLFHLPIGDIGYADSEAELLKWINRQLDDMGNPEIWSLDNVVPWKGRLTFIPPQVALIIFCMTTGRDFCLPYTILREMITMSVDDSRSLGYGALLTTIFIAHGIDLARQPSINTKAAINSFTIKKSGIERRLGLDPAGPSRPSSSSAAHASSSTSAPPAAGFVPRMPYPGTYSMLPPEFQNAFMALQVNISADLHRYVDHHYDALRDDIRGLRTRFDAQFGTATPSVVPDDEDSDDEDDDEDDEDEDEDDDDDGDEE
ncbi:hypothetical protein Dimus_025192 [Dionaea muscipula]